MRRFSSIKVRAIAGSVAGIAAYMAFVTGGTALAVHATSMAAAKAIPLLDISTHPSGIAKWATPAAWTGTVFRATDNDANTTTIAKTQPAPKPTIVAIR